MKAIDFEAELNPEQRTAATAGDGPLLILAAAGTGKTRTLVYRVAYLASRGVAAERILLLTFTNRAAREMLERATELTGGTNGMPWSGTFHHIANRLLRRHAPRIGYSAGYVILDQDDARKLMAAGVKDLGLQGREFPKREVLLHVLSYARNTGIALEDAIAAQFDGFDDVNTSGVQTAINRYETRKRELGVMDFDDLLVNALRLFEDCPDLRERYAAQFAHVLVDEYQDTNRIQAQLVDHLAAGAQSLFVVGDDFQSIYGWRGADPRNILEFRDRYPAARIYKLETNYRSVPEVLALANVTVARADVPEDYRKTLRAVREPYRRPTVARLRDGDHQAQHVVELLRHFGREGYRMDQIAVLYRAHFHAMELQLALTRARVPHQVTSGMRFFEQAHVKDVLSLLRLLVSPADALAFERLLGLLPGTGEATAHKLWERLGRRCDTADPATRATLAAGLRPAARERWRKIEPVIEDYHRDGTPNAGSEAVAQFVEAFYATYAADTFDNATDRLDDIRELALHVAKFDTLETCLSDVALLTNLDAEDEPGAAVTGAVRLSTVHQAKGLEWPVVIVLWAVEGMFPSSRSLNESGGVDAEERRLFYVAATRAKDELALCVPEVRRMRDGGIFYCRPSRFIEELPGTVAVTRRVSFIG